MDSFNGRTCSHGETPSLCLICNYEPSQSKADISEEEAEHLAIAIDQCCEVFHANAREKKFWDDIDTDDPRHVASLLALVHSEISEALEELRVGNVESFQTEMGDAMIRIFDVMGGLGLELGDPIMTKHLKNRKRAPKHGKRF